MDPTSVSTATDLATRAFASALSVEVIQLLKEWPRFKLLGPGQKRNNFIAGLIGAAVTAGGVHWTFDAASDTLNVMVPVQAVIHAIFDMAKSWVFQQYLWRLAVDKPQVDQSSTTNNTTLIKADSVLPAGTSAGK